MKVRPSRRILGPLVFSVAAFAALPALAQVQVNGAWVRATVTDQSDTGAYMVISADQDVTLTGASSPVSDHAKIHEMKMHGDMMMMMPVERLQIVAGHSLSLDERNYHVMLEGVKRRLQAGEKVPLTLRFVDAKGKALQVEVQAEVRPLDAHDGHDAHAGHMHDSMDSK
jgi:hypothetical protein